MHYPLLRRTLRRSSRTPEREKPPWERRWERVLPWEKVLS